MAEELELPAGDEDAPDIEAAVAVLTDITNRIVAQAQSLSYVVLGLLQDVKTELCVPLKALDGATLSADQRDRILVAAHVKAVALIDRIDFALSAHAGIETGTGGVL